MSDRDSMITPTEDESVSIYDVVAKHLTVEHFEQQLFCGCGFRIWHPRTGFGDPSTVQQAGQAVAEAALAWHLTKKIREHLDALRAELAHMTEARDNARAEVGRLTALLAEVRATAEHCEGQVYADGSAAIIRLLDGGGRVVSDKTKVERLRTDLPIVRTVGDLTARHVGRRVRVGSGVGTLAELYVESGSPMVAVQLDDNPTVTVPIDMACEVLP